MLAAFLSFWGKATLRYIRMQRRQVPGSTRLRAGTDPAAVGAHRVSSSGAAATTAPHPETFRCQDEESPVTPKAKTARWPFQSASHIQEQ